MLQAYNLAEPQNHIRLSLNVVHPSYMVEFQTSASFRFILTLFDNRRVFGRPTLSCLLHFCLLNYGSECIMGL